MRRSISSVALLSIAGLVAACGGGGAAPATSGAARTSAPAVATSAPAASQPAAGTSAPAASQPAVGTSAPAASASAAGGTTVGIRDFKFVPAELTTTSGTEVTWRNQDTAPHSVKWADDTESSPTLANGETYARTFTEAGTFEYVCGIHPNMKGSVVVS